MTPSERWRPNQVFVYRYPVDMRKQIQGLSNIVSMQLGRDPGDESMYVFTNKARDKIKLLIWHRNGFWLLYSASSKGWNIQRGESPLRGKNLNSLAWVAGWRVTKILKPTDKAVLGTVSESSGRNENERIGGLVKPNSNGRAPCIRVNAANQIEMRLLRSDSLAGY